jgi:hypothetical protein
VEDAIEVVTDGSMPPGNYTRIHRGTDLSEAEIDTLVAALAQIPDSSGDEGRGRDGRDDGGQDGDDDG